MFVTFYGATREVTGSFHVLTNNGDKILLDCGMFQGKRQEAFEKNRVFPVEPGLVTNMVLSHAHIDHSGRIPVLTSGGFKGRIYCSRATADACQFLLRDSAYIQENDASFLNYKNVKNCLSTIQQGVDGKRLSKKERKQIGKSLRAGKYQINDNLVSKLIDEHGLERVTPLYTMAQAEDSLDYFEGIPYRHPVKIGKGISCTLYEAGHILGSAMSVIRVEQENGETKKILFSGDLGRFNKPIIKDPNLVFNEEDREIDLLIMESTYGNRVHEPVQDMKPLLAEVVRKTHKRKGSVIIPAFSYGRTQEILYFLHELILSGEIPELPIYVDSPLATKITEVFGNHPETYDKETHESFLERGLNPFHFNGLKFVETVEESMALNRDMTPHIVLAGSGMCEGGRILHHLRHKIHNERNTVLLVGYMGRNTLGRRIQELAEKYEDSGRKGKPPVVRFYNKDYPLKAEVITLGGFSAHGDKNECLYFLQNSGLKIKKIALVHGEESQVTSFGEFLQSHGYEVEIPYKGQSITV